MGKIVVKQQHRHRNHSVQVVRRRISGPRAPIPAESHGNLAARKSNGDRSAKLNTLSSCSGDSEGADTDRAVSPKTKGSHSPSPQPSGRIEESISDHA